jgi:hypothetical protein
VLKSRCVSGERGRGAALGVLVVDVEGVFDVEGLGLGVAADVDGSGGGGRADIFDVVGFSMLSFACWSFSFFASWRFWRQGLDKYIDIECLSVRMLSDEVGEYLVGVAMVVRVKEVEKRKRRSCGCSHVIGIDSTTR